MSNQLISVVIPTYYRNEALSEAITSVRSQTHDPIEIIVVDGSGEAHAESVAQDHGVRYIAQERDEGPHAARSEGAIAATGDYVNFLDDDDRIRPTKFERQLSVFEEHQEVGVVYCAVEWENGHVIRPDPDIQGDVLEYALRFRMTPSSPSAMLIESGVLEEILPLRNTHGADDMGMKIELAQRTEFAFVDDPLVIKGTTGDSLGGSRENVRGRFQLLRDYANLYDQFPSEVYRDALAHTYLLDADLRLNEQLWSARAIYDAFRAWYHVPGMPVSFTGYFVASLLGRPGRDIARKAYDRVFLGDEHRGKIT